MRIGIFGAGGVGGYFAARLVAAGEQVAVIARGEHLKALRQMGLVVDSPRGNLVIPDPHATDDPREVGAVDLLIVAVKSWQLPEAARSMKAMVEEETAVLPLLNGVEATPQLAAVLGSQHVLKGLARIISYVAAPGRIHHVGAEPYIAVGEPDNRASARTERIVEMLRRAGIRAEIPKDIDVALWQKLLVVVPLGGVGAVTRAPIGALRSIPATRRMLSEAMQEIDAVARARGVEMSESVIAEAWAFLDQLPAAGMASLHRDISEGRRSELDAWTGAVVRLGAEVAVPTPVHEFIYRSLLPLELRARGEITFAK